EPTFLRLEDRLGGFPVQFVLMPYPTPNRFLKGESGLKYGSPEEKNNLLVSAWSDALRDIRNHPKYDQKAPAALGAHVHVHGAHRRTGRPPFARDADLRSDRAGAE